MRHLPLFLLIAVCLASCASQPRQERIGDVDYHLLMAEFALQRQQFDIAVSEYRSAAELGPSAELAARATRVAHEHGQPADLLASAGRWVELDAEDVEARSFLLMALVDSGDGRAAAEHLRFVVESAPDRAGGVFRVLALLLERDDPEAATAVARELTRSYGDLAEAHYALATLALQSDDDELARKAVERALAIQPEWPLARMLLARTLIAGGEEQEGLRVAGDVVREDGGVAVRLQYALLLVNSGYDEDARIQLERALEDEPENEDTLRTLAFVEYRLENFERAREYFGRLLSSPRYGDDAGFYLGAVHEASGDYSAAFAMYSRVRGEPNVVAAHVRASRMLYRMGEQERSLEYLASFADANPDYVVPMLVARANLLAEMDRSGEALELYRQGLEAHPGNDDLLYSLAFLYERLDRIDDALAELRALVEKKPDDATALNAYGYTLADRTTRYREAERHIRRALDIEPDNAAIIDSMGWVLYRRGRHQQALEYLERAWRLSEDPEIAAHLSEVLWMLGRAEEARGLIQEALASSPDSPHLQDALNRFGE